MGYIGNQITTVFPTSISVDSATISGNTTIGGTLGVTGATTLSNQLTDANMSAGSVVQVVSASHSTRVDSTSTSYADSGLTCNITPSSSSNKVLAIVSQNLGQDRDAQEADGSVQLLRDSTSIYENTKMSLLESGGSSTAKNIDNSPITILDSPSSTSALTYKTQIKCNTTSSNGTSRANWGGASHIILMEIVG